MNMPMSQTNTSGHEAARIVVTATRSWVWAIMADACRTARGRYVDLWNDCFDKLGSRDLSLMWGSFMRHLSLDANTKFLLGCSGCGRTSEDEQTLLNSLAAHQQGYKKDACTLLERWFSGEALWKADALVEAFADQLLLHGHTLPYALDDHATRQLLGHKNTRNDRLN